LSHPVPVWRVLGAVFSGVKLPGLEDDLLPVSSDEVELCVYILSRWHKINCTLWLGLLLNALSVFYAGLCELLLSQNRNLLASVVACQQLTEVG
jgi:hypothetical protein